MKSYFKSWLNRATKFQRKPNSTHYTPHKSSGGKTHNNTIQHIMRKICYHKVSFFKKIFSIKVGEASNLTSTLQELDPINLLGLCDNSFQNLNIISKAYIFNIMFGSRKVNE